MKGKTLRRFVLRTMGMALLVAAGGCGDSVSGPKDPSELEFAALTGVNLAEMTRTSTGLYWKDIVVGTGDEAQPGGWVTVHYTGWLHDGTVFDTSVGGDPVRFPLTGVIAGWQEGVPGMKVGGKRKLVIPPSLGYGSHPYGGIPGNSTLVFDVELIGVG